MEGKEINGLDAFKNYKPEKNDELAEKRLEKTIDEEARELEEQEQEKNKKIEPILD